MSSAQRCSVGPLLCRACVAGKGRGGGACCSRVSSIVRRPNARGSTLVTMNCYDDSQLLCNGQRETVQYIHDMYHPTTPGTREHRRFLGLGGVRDGVTHPLHHYHIQLQPLPPFWSADTDQPLHRPHMVLTLLPSLRNLPSSQPQGQILLPWYVPAGRGAFWHPQHTRTLKRPPPTHTSDGVLFD